MIKHGKVVIISLSLVIITTSLFIFNSLYRPMYFSKNTNMILVINKNTTARSLVNNLKTQKLIGHDILLLTYIKIFGISKKLKAGIFEIHSEESVTQLLKRVVDFDVLKKTFQITAGNTNTQLAAQLQEAQYLNYTKSSWANSLLNQSNFLEICSNNRPLSKVEQKCQDTIKSIDNLQKFEGLYLADTYQYNAGSDAETLLLSAYTNLKNCLYKAWEQRNSSLPYVSPYELLIVASILEKESALIEDKRLISGVIVNRLRKNMPLQMDPTVIYGLQDKYKGKLSHDDLQIESEYNTYKNRGLPPTPISIVSCESINAASQPTLTDYLYFVAQNNKSGKHIFSKTYSEHRIAINEVDNG